MKLTLEDNSVDKTNDNNIIEKFSKELSNFLENNDLEKFNQLEQYCEKATLMREYLGTSVGIPITTCNNEFKDILEDLFHKGMRKLSKDKGTIYLLQAWSSKEEKGITKYAVGEYKDGEFKGYQYLPKSKLPKFKEIEEIIFTYNDKGKIEVRNDLKEKMAENFIEDLQYLKEVELKRNKGFKKEGHIYRVSKSESNESIIYLTNIQKKSTIEDLEFSMNDYKQDGLYQVKNGKYVKVPDNIVKNENKYIKEVKLKEKKENPIKSDGFSVEKNFKKYNKYWNEYSTTLADKVGQRLGLSILNGKNNSIIEKTLDETLMELAKTEKKDIYRYDSIGGFFNKTILVDKYAKDGSEPQSIPIPLEELPDKSVHDKIFIYDKDGKTTLRDDLKEKAMKITEEKLRYLKDEENKALQEFKQEGYLYKYSTLGKILYNFQTKGNIQDLDFVFNKEKGTGLYQIINGEYKKIEM